RIEVLRGPQGTLFGRNTTGGAVNLILKKPAEQFGGYYEVGFGQFAAYSVRASVDVPQSDRVLTKFSGYYLEDDGYVSNPVTGEDDLNAAEALGLRAALRFNINERLTWDFAVQYGRDEGANVLNFVSGSGGRAYSGTPGASPLVPIPATGPQVELEPQRAGLPPTSTAAQSILARCTGVITRSRFSCTGLRQTGTPLAALTVGSKRNLNLGNTVTNMLWTSNVGWETALGNVNFITGYVDLNQEFALDFMNGTVVNTAMGLQPSNPAGGFTIANVGDHEQFSQEIKLTGDLSDSIRYVAGLYYFDEDNDTDFVDLLSVGPTTTLVLEDRRLKNKTRAWAAYTQWDFKFADRWTVTLGGRYTDETKKVDFVANGDPLLPAPTTPNRVSSANMAANGIPLKQNTGLFTPRFAVKFDVNDDINLFASATRGFKSGGWNARGTVAAANQPFAPEKVWSYEAGLRSDWLDGKLRFNLTAFKLDVEDLQTPSAFTAPTGAVTFITRNFAGLDNKGAEAELIFAPIRDLTLFVFAGVQDAKYVDIAAPILTQLAACQSQIAAMGATPSCNQGIVTNSGTIAPPVRTPDTLTVGASYTFRFGDRWALTPNVVWAKTSDNNVATSAAPVALVDGYDTLDAGLTFGPIDGNWQLQAHCRNCTDEIQIVSALVDLPYIQEPRKWSISFRYSFGTR
ncbi:MAG: TonB-dependent receptor, partial [Steroidobacteraceae bacterium]|nr:TonB-dependent receptor [Steroidobacteraceae bacterium]MDW8259122.1 TonB-dependent receptor [Gammaproteobacteria bacterium]